MEITSHSGKEVYEVIEKQFGLDFLYAYAKLENELKKEFGEVQIISESFRNEKGDKGLEMFVMGEKGFTFIRLSVDIFGKMEVVPLKG